MSDRAIYEFVVAILFGVPTMIAFLRGRRRTILDREAVQRTLARHPFWHGTDCDCGCQGPSR